MQLFGRRVFEDQNSAGLAVKRNAGQRLRAITAAMLTLAAGVPSGFAQQQSGGVTGAGAKGPDRAGVEVSRGASASFDEPLNLRPARDFSQPAGRLLGNPINMYRATTIPKASLVNSVRLDDLVKDGKIYLSLSDAMALALENNYDIAIARYDLDIADTDILRTRTGAAPLGAPAGLVEGTLSGSQATLSTGGGPGGTSAGSGGAGSGLGGIDIYHRRRGAAARAAGADYHGYRCSSTVRRQPSSSFFTGGKTATSNTYNFGYNQGFVTGTAFQFTLDNNTVHVDQCGDNV